MKITQEEVTHVANLSKLKFTENETAEFATTLSKIVDMVELLSEVDTTGVEPTTTMADCKTVLRPDVAEKGTDRDHLSEGFQPDVALRIQDPYARLRRS
jgi:aspartyl/glutamyl-tRNA(Asn/Gln) amidotransferase, C subunit